MTETQKEPKSLMFFKFDTLALIIGFIVDIITLVSIVLSIQTPEISKNLPNFITPGLAFGLWILAVYLYFAFLRSFWEKHEAENKYSKVFHLFLADDLLFGFRNPILLFPGVVALVTLFWIASTNGVFLGVVIVVLVIFGLPSLGMLYDYVKGTRESTRNSIPKEFKERVITEWRFISSHINEFLAKQMWVDNQDLGTLATIWEVPEYYMNYVLAQFALKNSKRTKFGYLYTQEGNDPLNYGEKVLINLETLNRDKYYYT